MSSSSRRVAVSRCRWPTSSGSPGSVTSTASSRRRCSSSLRLERRGALLDQRLERPPGLVAALADRARRCSGASSGSSAGSASARPCGPGSGRAAPRARSRRRGLEHRPLGLLGEPLRRAEAVRRPGRCGSAARVRHRSWHDIRTGRGSRSSRRSATPRRRGRPGRGRSRRRRPRSRRAGRRARLRARTATRPGELELAQRARPRPGTSAIAAVAGAPRASSQVGAGDAAAPKTAPMLARTALGPNGSAVRGLSTTSAGAERVRRRAGPCRRCRDRRRRAGRATGPAVAATVPMRCPALLARRRSRASPLPSEPAAASASRSTRHALDLGGQSRGRPRARRRPASRTRSRGARAVAQRLGQHVLALGHEQARCARGACARAACAAP